MQLKLLKLASLATCLIVYACQGLLDGLVCTPLQICYAPCGRVRMLITLMCASLFNKMASLASESTPQATTLRKHFSDLVRAVQDPAILAVDLYSADIITQTLLERVNSATALTTKDKTSLLLSAVSDQTVVSPGTFDTFLSILCEDHGPSLPDIVEKIKDSMLGSPGGMYELAVYMW